MRCGPTADNPLVVGETTVQARHITELRTAINTLRAREGMAAYSWTASATTSDWITAAPIAEMRTALDQVLGPPPSGYSSGLASGQPIKAIHIQELRDRLTTAWSIDIRWLVTDQLGTPRMIFDQTGSLSGTSRHDYLPFGEELFAGTGGRTTAQGYSVGDGLRQKFTQKERDNETGLDFFGARYYGSGQGRFTSADPMLSSGVPAEPQSWDRFSYCLNRPLKYVDPKGLIWEKKKTGDATEYKWISGDAPEDGYEKVTEFYVEGVIDGKQVGVRFNPNGPASVAKLLSYDIPGGWLYADRSDYNVKGYEIGPTNAQLNDFSKRGSVDMMPNQAFDIGLTFPVGGIGGGALKAAEGAAVAREVEGLVGVPEASINRASARLYGMNVGGKPIVNSVEAFGSRAGSLFRGRGPLPSSDLDLFVDMHPSFQFGRSAAHIDRTLGSIAGDFEREAGYKLQFTFSKRGLQETPFVPLKKPGN